MPGAGDWLLLFLRTSAEALKLYSKKGKRVFPLFVLRIIFFFFLPPLPNILHGFEGNSKTFFFAKYSRSMFPFWKRTLQISTVKQEMWRKSKQLETVLSDGNNQAILTTQCPLLCVATAWRWSELHRKSALQNTTCCKIRNKLLGIVEELITFKQLFLLQGLDLELTEVHGKITEIFMKREMF